MEEVFLGEGELLKLKIKSQNDIMIDTADTNFVDYFKIIAVYINSIVGNLSIFLLGVNIGDAKAPRTFSITYAAADAFSVANGIRLIRALIRALVQSVTCT